VLQRHGLGIEYLFVDGSTYLNTDTQAHFITKSDPLKPGFADVGCYGYFHKTISNVLRPFKSWLPSESITATMLLALGFPTINMRAPSLRCGCCQRRRGG
jgi:hypothetical protein